MDIWKEMCKIAQIPEEELIIINSLDLNDKDEQSMYIDAEKKIIDEYIREVVEKIGYIPKDCKDKNLVYQACLGCGLCQGTNPIQVCCLKDLEEYPGEYCEYCKNHIYEPDVGINACARDL